MFPQPDFPILNRKQIESTNQPNLTSRPLFKTEPDFLRENVAMKIRHKPLALIEKR